MSIEFRNVRPHESKDYRAFRLEALRTAPDAFGAVYEDEQAKEKLYFETLIEQAPANKFMMGAFQDDQLIGICGFVQEDNPKSRHRGNIIQMFVHPDSRGQQVGRQLLEATLGAAFQLPEIELIHISVVADNTRAHQLYLDAGFVEYGLSRRHFKSGEKYTDERFMVLERKAW